MQLFTNFLQKLGLLSLLWLGLGLSTAWANYLRITNVMQDQAAGTVTFDLAWDNSWNIDGLGAPNHWDAAWVFVKLRECGAPAATAWTHGLITPTLGAHTFGDLEPTLSNGSAVGIDAAPNNTGVMLRRSTAGLYPAATATTVTLDLTNFPAAGDYEVRVFGIEMVYVPQGEYLLGGTNESTPLGIGGVPTLVSSEAALAGLSNTSNATLPAAYPKGYAAFYSMKYEISQGQYAAFLNTLDATSMVARFPNNFNNYRHRITNGGTPPNIYYSDRPDRACNYLSWADLLAYLDWAALRPMTDLEYEKACRGVGPYVGGYAWGSTSITEASLVATPEDGTELILTADANSHYQSNNLNGGDGGNGPLRVGIFATNSSSSRQETGATYYGIMEMSGNVWEQTVCAWADAQHTGFDGAWGDGSLDANGVADVATWPYVDCTGTCYRSLRGGSYADITDRLRVSDRYWNYYNNTSRQYNIGGRGVR